MSNAKYIGRSIGVLSKYQAGVAYQTRIKNMPLSVLGELHIKALKNGLNDYDEMFVADCLDRIDITDDISFTADEYNKSEFNRVQWDCHINPEKLITFLKAKGFTHQQIADTLEVSVPTVQRWANNKTMPHKEAMAKLIHLCNEH